MNARGLEHDDERKVGGIQFEKYFRPKVKCDEVEMKAQKRLEIKLGKSSESRVRCQKLDTVSVIRK